jgi:hypothetical protein
MVSLAAAHQISTVLPRASLGRVVGRLYVSAPGKPFGNYTLTAPKISSSMVTLLRRGGLVVRSRPNTQGAAWALRIDGLPAGVTAVQMSLAGRGGPIIH